MSSILDEMNDALMHYGTPRHSGRYPWGSGEHPFQSRDDFLSYYDKLKNEGMSQKEIADYMGLSTTEIRLQKSMASAERRSIQVEQVKNLREKGLSTIKISEQTGIPESTVRSLLNSESEARMNKARVTAEYLKQIVDEKGMLDVGTGVERELGVSKEKLNEALKILQDEYGYPVYGGGIPQATNPGKQTNQKVLCPPGTEHKDIYSFDQIHSVNEYEKILTEDGERISNRFEYPASLDSKRLMINYAEDGGIKKDGVIEIRRGLEDLNLGEAHYAQVRILVDGDRYLKGMAVYADDLPDGIDIRFNTNKTKDVPMEDVLKKIKNDPDNPFGALIKRGGQTYYDDPNGKYVDPVTGNKQSLNLVNKTREEGDWDAWSDELPSQFLSKQSMPLIKKQLSMSLDNRQSELDEIRKLTNPTVKKQLLMEFADDCESNAIDLKAAALPRQKYQVILPLVTVKDDEVYAPNYKNGEKVALIRYPHGGTFEIPILTVNNNIKEGQKLVGKNPTDIVGINKKVADQLSGADFDGDTVMVIPTNSKVKIKSTPPLKDLEGFDGKLEYGYSKKVENEDGSVTYYRGDKAFKPMKKGSVQGEMGKVSNLITDMTLKGAPDDEIARAVKHSMVVIDAEKHKLDYKASERDNDIPGLKKKWQGHTDLEGNYHEGGASTLLSRAKGQTSVDKRQGMAKIDPDTGEKYYKTADDDKLYFTDYKTGKTKKRTEKSQQMAEVKDARILSSGTEKEEAYAAFANALKDMAREARKEALSTGKIAYDKNASRVYAEEVKSLNEKLEKADLNKPKERMAQRIAKATVDAKRNDNPGMTKEEVKKANQQALEKAREQVGASGKDVRITFTDREWEAIQAGAISESKLTQILKSADKSDVRAKATPRSASELSASQVSKIKARAANGYTNAQIADSLGISVSTVIKYLNE